MFLDPFSAENVPDIFKNELARFKKVYNKNNLLFKNNPCSFFKLLSYRYKLIKENAYIVNTYFHSTYNCEQLFSLLKLRKNKYSSRLTNNNLTNCIKLIAANKIIPNINDIVNKK